MNGWLIGVIVAVVIVPPAVLGWSLCRAAALADEAMEDIEDR